MKTGRTLLLPLLLCGCPATVDVLEASAEGPALTLEEDHAFDRYRITLDTPLDAYPDEFGYLEHLSIHAALATDATSSGTVAITLLAADTEDTTMDGERRGQLYRAPLYLSTTEIELQLSLYRCDEDTNTSCRRTIDVDFIKSGRGPVEGTWRVEHRLDWSSNDNGDPPADAVTTLTIEPVE